jgi:hypothetical protein
MQRSSKDKTPIVERQGRNGHTVFHIADVDIGRTIEFRGAEPGADPVVRLKPGETLDFELEYHFHDDSAQRDQWEFRLDVAVDGRETPPAHYRIDDDPYSVEDGRGVLRRGIQFNKPGEYRLKVTSEARHELREWEGPSRPTKREAKTQTVTVPVRVS